MRDHNSHMHSKPEPTLTGNPNRLTISQHIIPVATIRRFTNKSGKVLVSISGQKSPRFETPNANDFKAIRSWDHGTESGFMKQIEDKYQDLVNKVLPGNYILDPAKDRDFTTITDMFCLWQARFKFKKPTEYRITLANVGNKPTVYNKHLEEELEKNNITLLSEDGTISGRSMQGARLINYHNYLYRLHSQIIWTYVVFPNEVNLIVPDYPSFPYLPVTPASCFIDFRLRHLSWKELNARTIENAEKYTFCHSG